MTAPSSIVLTAGASSAAEARRAVIAAVEALDRPDLADDAALCASELVANAVLHAGTDVTLSVLPVARGVRIEVADEGPGMPRPVPAADPDRTTGRGLHLLTALADRWGVDPTPGGAGKAVWFELGVGDDDPGDGDRVVHLVDVPVRLLLASLAHLDDTLREVQLLRIGGEGSPVPEPLVGRLTDLVAGLAPLRRAMVDQARRAVAEGDLRATVFVALPDASVEAVEEAGAVVDEIAGWCADGTLLSAAPSVELQAYRRWANAEMRRQLQGGSPAPCPFPATGDPDRQRLERDLRLALRAGRLGTWRWDSRTGEVAVDGTYESLFGFPAGGYDGAFETWLGAIHPDDRAGVQATLERALATGGTYVVEHRVVRPDGTVGWLRGQGEVIADDQGEVIGTAGCVADVTERHEAEVDRDRLLDQAVRLQEATAALAAALGVDDVARVVLEHAAVALGAVGGGVYLLEGDELRLLSAGGYPDHIRQRWGRVPLSFEGPIAEVARTRQPVFLESPAHLASRFPRVEREAGLVDDQRWADLPLLAAGARTGVLVLAWSDARPFADDERVFLMALAGQCAQALHRARLWEREHSIAEALQRSLLPAHLPFVPGLAAAARYLPGTAGFDVGGDWYDLVHLAGGVAAIGVGDVIGKGLEAATVMGQVRNAVRSLAVLDRAPGAVLDGLDRLFATFDGETMATMAYGVLDAATGELRVGNAGHLPPIVLGPDGAVHVVAGVPAVPLGLGPGGPLWTGGPVDRQEVRTVVPKGGAVLLVSDGLVEAPSRPLSDGLELLAATAAEIGPDDVEVLCDRLVARLVADERRDDVCVLAVRRL